MRLFTDNFGFALRIQVNAIELVFLVAAAVCRATRSVANRENESDNDKREQSKEYPATVADKVVLNPRDHVRVKEKVVQVRFAITAVNQLVAVIATLLAHLN